MSVHQLERVRQICTALPETTERRSHGEPTFFVRGKVYVMFADNHHGDGRVAVWLPAPPGAQEALVETTPATFFRPPYVGSRGWLGINLDAIADEQLRLYIETAWELVAPKRLRASRVSSNSGGGSGMTQPHQGQQLPIGYWLKRVDELLTERSNGALAGRGFTRLRWQLLNSVAEAGTLGREQLHSTLAPFAAADELDTLAAGLVEAGLVAAGEAGDTLSLTEAGQAEREQLLQLQQTVRARAFNGVSAEEYAALVDVLQRVARNLA
jgi:hypothetical protein